MPVAWAAEDAFSRVTGAKIDTSWPFFFNLHNGSNQFTRRIIQFLTIPSYCRSKLFRSTQDVFMFLMDFPKKLIPLFCNPSLRISLYLFDVWEPGWNRLEEFLSAASGIQRVFMSSYQAAEHFRDRLRIEVKWVPQAANSSEFSFVAKEWKRKKNIIINMGRKNRVLDDFLVEFSRKYNFDYIRGRYPGEVRFKFRKDFLNALYSARVVVVHPQNLDQPEKTGCVSMLTARYFEAYQSGGVVCGFKPHSGEFEKVLGGFPFVEYTNSCQFESDLLSAIASPEPWIAAVDLCREFHTWERRLLSIKSGHKEELPAASRVLA